MEDQPLAQKQESVTGKISIKPTGLPVSGQYSDIAMTNLVGLHVHQVNSERQAIWQRYSAMLIANSIFFGVLMNRSLGKTETVVVTLIGVVLCYFWWKVTKAGWNIFDKRWKAALDFYWENLPENAHPYKETLQYFKDYQGDIISKMALLIIYLFVISYLFFGTFSLFR